MTTDTLQDARIVAREEWLLARQELLAQEKQLTRQRDAVNAARRALPWVRIERSMSSILPRGKRPFGISSTDAASSSSTTSCGGANWGTAASAARSLPTMSTAPTCIWRITTSASLLSPARRCPRWRGIQTAYGLALPMGVVDRERFQL